MNKVTNWLNRIFSDCLGRRCAGHEPLKECGGDGLDVVELKRIPIIQTSPIFHLNDDCILQIFSHLSLHDLASVSLTCQQFQVLAEYEFAQQNRNKQFTCCDAVVFGYSEVKDDERLSRALDIMKAFGRLIDTIIVFDIIYFRFLPLLQAEMNLQAWHGDCSTAKSLNWTIGARERTIPNNNNNNTSHHITNQYSQTKSADAQ